MTGSINIISIPSNVTIFIDGIERTGTTPSTIEDLIPGYHTYKLSYPGYIDEEGMILIIESEINYLYIIMKQSFSIRDALVYGFIASFMAGLTLYALSKGKSKQMTVRNKKES